MKKRVIIIGGGAAGSMAALTAAQNGADVLLLEQNEMIGRKILSTGNGRCNFTNRFQDPSCYSYSREMAEEYVKMGFYIGIGGVVTFKNAKKLKDVAAAIPIEKIVLETDCPYMAPEPYRGKRNQSSYIRYVAEKIAELKEMSPEEVIAVTEKNARDLYGI